MEAVVSYDRLKEVKEFDDSKIGVKGLSDAGITTIPNIFVHSPETLFDLKTSSKSVELPVIDLSDIDSASGRSRIVKQVKEASKTWGFFQVINHGIPTTVLEGTIDAVKAFHELPTEKKAKYYKREEGHGVIYTSNSDLYRAKAATWHDTLLVWLSPDQLNASDIPEVCRKEVLEWNIHGLKIAETLMELLSEGLGLEAGKFKELSFSNSRLFLGHIYPYCPQPNLTLGITPHTDSAFLTILLQNQVQGLQVKHGDEWVEARPLVGGLLVNIGDFLQIVSNGEYRSVEHRVLANSSSKPRISIVMFLNLIQWKGSGYYGPLPELLTADKPPIYRNFTKQEFFDNFYTKGLDSKSLIEKVSL